LRLPVGSGRGSGRDPQAARERLEVLNAMILLETTTEALALEKALIQAGALPPEATDDALHIAIAATNGVPFLLTWNCRHLANATMRPMIEAVCASNGLMAPIICTPEQLSEVEPCMTPSSMKCGTCATPTRRDSADRGRPSSFADRNGFRVRVIFQFTLKTLGWRPPLVRAQFFRSLDDDAFLERQ
jgi:hypothetical protein